MSKGGILRYRLRQVNHFDTIRHGLSSLYHTIFWYAAEQVDPGEYFNKYAVLGDDIVIADARIAEVYAQSVHY